MADDDQHQTRERQDREPAFVAVGAEARGERIAQRRHNRRQVNAQKQD